MRLTRRKAGCALLCAAVTAASLLTTAPAALASAADCHTGASVGFGSAQTFLFCTVSGNGSPSRPPTYGTWTPPVCWIEPQYTPQALKSYVEGLMATGLAGVGSEGGQWLAAVDDNYLALSPPYHIGDNGMWWGVDCRTNDLTYETAYMQEMAAAGLDVYHPWKWVPAGAPVNVPNAMSPRLLAEIALAQITPDDVAFLLSPAGTQTVNLSTRVYARSAYKTISATAGLPGMPSSTVTATPTSVTIYPGGPASTAPGGAPVSSITCPVSGGTFGSAVNDSCAFYYLKSTAAGYTITATMSWTVAWAGHATPPGWQPIVTSSVPQAVKVQEVQTVVGN